MLQQLPVRKELGRGEDQMFFVAHLVAQRPRSGRADSDSSSAYLTGRQAAPVPSQLAQLSVAMKCEVHKWDAGQSGEDAGGEHQQVLDIGRHGGLLYSQLI